MGRRRHCSYLDVPIVKMYSDFQVEIYETVFGVSPIVDSKDLEYKETLRYNMNCIRLAIDISNNRDYREIVSRAMTNIPAAEANDSPLAYVYHSQEAAGVVMEKIINRRWAKAITQKGEVVLKCLKAVDDYYAKKGW